MSVLIKDMVMPSSCRLCGFNDYCYCTIRGLYVDGTATHGRASFCPLAELPEKHGRLIDADAMCNDLATVDPRYKTMIDWCIRVTEAQPTIVEAEGEEGKDESSN